MRKILKGIYVAACISAIGLGTACATNTQSTTEETNMESSITLSVSRDDKYPYVDEAREYLSTFGADVHNYVFGKASPCQAIEISWKYEGEPIEGYTVTYATKSDYSDGITVQVDKEREKCLLYNLYKATTYYYCVEATLVGGGNCKAEGTFKTTDIGPRVMEIDGIYNVRDVGGYKTDSGARTKQGLFYRGGSLRPADIFKSDLTEEGQAYMSDVLGIKSDFDIRGMGAESGNLTTSPIPGAQLKYVALDGYMGAFRIKEHFRQAFSFLADKDNYPVYVHCTGGADRTGTLVFLYNALLGVSEGELIQDYEFTSFSVYGERNSKAGTTYGDMFQEFLTTLKSYEGETLKEKTESYLLEIGVTAAEIASIRSIMLG